MGKHRTLVTASVVISTVMSMSPVAAHAAAAATKLTASISGAPAGAQVLAVSTTGASARAPISGGRFTVTLPRSRSQQVNVSLHLIGPDGQYAGPVTMAKKVAGKTKWYGSVAARAGRTTKLGAIVYSAAQKYASMKATATTARLAFSNALQGASKAGQPAGAGRLGLAVPKSVSSQSLAAGDSIDWEWGVRAFATSDTQAGGDLDGDGLPNTLDIDDDGDGTPDQVDPSSSAKGSKPTAQYDAFSSLTTAIGDRQPAINYNFLSVKYPDAAELRKQLSLLDDSAFTLNTRVVAPFLSEDMSRWIRDAWVDCSQLAWCLTADQGSGDSLVAAPRMLPWGDGFIKDYWKYAFKKAGQTSCSIYVPSTSNEGCNEVLWGDFSQWKMLSASKANGGALPASAPSWADHTGGFGLYDSNYDNPPGGKGNASGFDLTANIRIRNSSKFLDNFRPGDVITVKALMNDGTPAEISMTIAPFFVTAPAIIGMTSSTGTEQTIDYVKPAPCPGMDSPDCRLGEENRPLLVPLSNPKVTVKFWRPQRIRMTGNDDGISGTQPFIDMGGLNYRFSASSGDGGSWAFCYNDAVTMKDTDNSVFTEVKADPQYSNSWDYWKDGSSDTAPAAGRYITATVDFSKCRNLKLTEGSKWGVRLDASGEEMWGGARTNANQAFTVKFVAG